MLTFKQYLKQRNATPTSNQRRNMLGEQIEMNPADLIDELLAMNAKSIHAQIVTDTDDELTLYLQLKKRVVMQMHLSLKWLHLFVNWRYC